MKRQLSSRQTIAHIRQVDGEIQTLETHLHETACLCSLFASASGLPLCGKLIGFLHDIGKYSLVFQQYIREAAGLMGEDARVVAESKQGTIDHAAAGAIHVWRRLAEKGNTHRLLAQILSSAIMSHHSRTGIKDFISLDGKSNFLNRLRLLEEDCHYNEVFCAVSPKVLEEIDKLLSSQSLLDEFRAVAVRIKHSTQSKTINRFSFGMLTHFLFSCLLDADRLSTANFENPKSAAFRTTALLPDWGALTEKLESHLASFPMDSEINRIRGKISEECRESSGRPGSIFTLSVPTGGGKTLASLRFALHRAAQSTGVRFERIIYVVPYTSILEQNAGEARKILGDANILEHHSNLIPEKDTWRNRLLSENWDAPVIFTTSVQFLDSLFAKGTRTARRMHQLANAIVIFDEVQSLPIKTIHLFNNAILFLATHTKTTILLCTATMPLLQKVEASLGALPLTAESEIISDKKRLFDQLRRTEIIDRRRDNPWSHAEISAFALECARLHRSALVVCNTKNSARKLFKLLRSTEGAPEIVHLSTSMYPAHRRKCIKKLKSQLAPGSKKSVICVSTQLIEAGVDLDFGCVIRSLAGMDSIVQSGGRCNRHRYRAIGYVYILNFAEEPLPKALADITQAQQDTLRVLTEFRETPEQFNHRLLSEEAMDRYYRYHHFHRAAEMLYPLRAGTGNPPVVSDSSILALLTENPGGIEAARRENHQAALELPLHQAFSTAAQAFCVIDAPTHGIIVSHGKGRKIIADLCAALGNEAHPLAEQIRLLKCAQQFTVNVFPHIVEKLTKEEAIREVQAGTGIYYLDERYYDPRMGVTLEALSELHYLQT